MMFLVGGSCRVAVRLIAKAKNECCIKRYKHDKSESSPTPSNTCGLLEWQRYEATVGVDQLLTPVAAVLVKISYEDLNGNEIFGLDYAFGGAEFEGDSCNGTQRAVLMVISCLRWWIHSIGIMDAHVNGAETWKAGLCNFSRRQQ